MRPARYMMRSTIRHMIEASGARGEVGRCDTDWRVSARFADLDHASRFLAHLAEINLWWPPAHGWTPAPEGKIRSVEMTVPDRHRDVFLRLIFNPRWLEHAAT
jgi:hypothetical protein